jgi:tetratricopeptide (TPR) repeat protein
MEQYAGAISAFQSYLARNPGDLSAHVYLAIAYSEAGRQADARAQIAEVYRSDPQYSIEELKQRTPPMDSKREQRWFADLRRAGLK